MSGEYTPVGNAIQSSNGFSNAGLLTKLTATVYYHVPLTKPSPTSPSAILLFGWMGAPIRHMTKFAEYYSKTLFPGTPIIVVLSPANTFFAADHKRKAHLQPAYIALQALRVKTSDILVHMFSNGGLNAFRTFVSLIPQQSFTPRVLVIDSAPGKAKLSTAITAFTMDIRSRFSRLWTSILVVVIYIYAKMKHWIFRMEPPIDSMRRWLNDRKAIGKETRKLYLYSDGDRLVLGGDVKEHALHARENGYYVKEKNFGESRHVGHMRANPEMYWQEILEIWKE
jgi:hypothetical protein